MFRLATLCGSRVAAPTLLRPVLTRPALAAAPMLVSSTGVSITSQRRFKSQMPVDDEEDDWMKDFDENDFIFLDELLEGGFDTPEFLDEADGEMIGMEDLPKGGKS